MEKIVGQWNLIFFSVQNTIQSQSQCHPILFPFSWLNSSTFQQRGQYFHQSIALAKDPCDLKFL